MKDINPQDEFIGARWPDPQTVAFLRAVHCDPRRLRPLSEGGPDWLWLRGRAFHVMLVVPLRSAWRRCRAAMSRMRSHA
jgi:hypothetical protein